MQPPRRRSRDSSTTIVTEPAGWEHQGQLGAFQGGRPSYRRNRHPDVRRLFRLAHHLHINFYEEWLESADVAQGLDDMAHLLDKLEPLALP